MNIFSQGSFRHDPTWGASNETFAEALWSCRIHRCINSWCMLYTIQPILAVCTFQPHNKASTRTIRKEPWQKDAKSRFNFVKKRIVPLNQSLCSIWHSNEAIFVHVFYNLFFTSFCTCWGSTISPAAASPVAPFPWMRPITWWWTRRQAQTR